ASDCMTNSTPTRCKIVAWIRTTRISRSVTGPTSATTPAPPRCCARSAPAPTSGPQSRRALAPSRIALLSNNPDKGAQLARLGITIARQIPTALHLNETNAAYLTAKARRGGHELLSRSLERAAEPHRHTGPAHLGTADR